MFFLLTAAVNVNSPLQTSALDLILQAGWMVKFVLFCLLFASVLSWTVILMKHKAFKLAHKQSQAFLNVFWYGKNLDEVFTKTDEFPHSPVASVFKAGFKELKKFSNVELLEKGGITNLSRALTRATISEIGSLEKTVGVLATVASAAPFIGLFGTVWGIMNSFQGIGATGSANLAVVAPGISEALIATAAGLAAAIPAVMFYNYFIAKIKALATEMDAFSQDFLNIVQRGVLKSNG